MVGLCYAHDAIPTSITHPCLISKGLDNFDICEATILKTFVTVRLRQGTILNGRYDCHLEGETSTLTIINIVIKANS